ncbi:MAG: nitrilase-related carbon-nitrogen hydrolase [Nitrososphaerales archaeon]
MRKIRIAVTQFKLRPFKRFEMFRYSVLKLMNKSKNADVVVFGEWFTLGLVAIDIDLEKAKYSDIKGIVKYTDDYIEFFSKLARERDQFIVGGTTVEEENGRYYDTCFMFDPSGRIYKHRKTHLFPLEKEKWGMSEYDTLNVVKTKSVKMGVCICYESQIPECARALALNGAEIIFCPSFTLTDAGYYRIRHACEARSVENQLITVMSSVIGKLSSKLVGIGRSAILSPCDKPWPSNGVIADGVMNREMVVGAEINIDNIYTTREKGAARAHADRIRRSSLYEKWYQSNSN